MELSNVVDLSQRMIPDGEANFELKLDSREARESMPELEYDDSIWYKIGYVNMCLHNGTHIECPYHHIREGQDFTQFPVAKLIGNLIVLDFTQKTPADMITLEELKQHDDEIKEGDIVFIRTGMDKLFRDPEHWSDYPYITIEAIRWLIEKKIACLGTDAAGIEDIMAYNQPGHVTLFKGNIPLVESLTNLDKVTSNEYLAFILPLPMEKADASPVRVVAVKKDALLRAAQK